MAGEPLIEARDLAVLYGRRAALDGVGLKVAAGARLALLGPNGAGKSTLLGVLGGALAPDRGAALVGGLSPERFRQGPRNLGWLPERAPLSAELTVLEHLRLAARLRGLGRAEEKSEIERLAEALALGDKLSRLAGGLSSGSRRQAALAAALLGRPRLLLLDEPTSALDPEEAKRLAALLGQLEPEATLIISTHALGEAAAVTSAAAILDNGRLAAHGSWDQLSQGAGPEAAYFGAVGASAAAKPEGGPAEAGERP
jgi:ABC-2 type transport system ATP-binding protein